MVSSKTTIKLVLEDEMKEYSAKSTTKLSDIRSDVPSLITNDVFFCQERLLSLHP